MERNDKHNDKDCDRRKLPSWLNKKFVITIIVIYVIITIGAVLWMDNVTGWGNWFFI